MFRKSRPELRHAEQRIRAIGEDCMTDDFPMFRRRLAFPISVIGGVLMVFAQFLEYLEPYRFDLAKVILLGSGLFGLGIALVLRLWRRTWQ